MIIRSGDLTIPSKSDIKERRWKKRSSLNEGDTLFTKYNREYTIGKYIKSSNRYECIFADIVRFCSIKEIRSGQILHPEDKTVYGVGFIGRGIYSNNTHQSAYRKWQSMMKRVYSNDPHYFKYKLGVSICEEWHNFQNFANWFYVEWSGEVNYELDKDLYYIDKPLTFKKTYSPETCHLLHKDINRKLSYFTYNPKHAVEGGKHRVNLSIEGKVYELGRYYEKFNADLISIRTFIGSLQKMLRDYKVDYEIDLDQIMYNYKEVYENQ